MVRNWKTYLCSFSLDFAVGISVFFAFCFIPQIRGQPGNILIAWLSQRVENENMRSLSSRRRLLFCYVLWFTDDGKIPVQTVFMNNNSALKSQGTHFLLMGTMMYLFAKMSTFFVHLQMSSWDLKAVFRGIDRYLRNE